MPSPLAASPCACPENPSNARPATSSADLENCLKINEIFLIKYIYAE
jgi:hypothetical protein